MNRGGVLPILDDIGRLVSAKHSDSLLEFFDMGFKSIYLFMQLLGIAEDETLRVLSGFRRDDSLARTEFPFRP